MLKEIKYLFFIFTILLFIFFTLNYYFSDKNKKNSYRLIKINDDKIEIYSQKLILLKNDTSDVVEYIEKTKNKNKKNYNFWKLITNNE